MAVHLQRSTPARAAWDDLFSFYMGLTTPTPFVASELLLLPYGSCRPCGGADEEEGGKLADITNIEATCQRYYHLGEAKPTQSQRNNITQLCRRGQFKRAFQIGREWFVDWDEEGKEDGN